MNKDETLLQTSAHAILREAIQSPFGIVVEITNTAGTVVAPALRAKQTLYRFKSENADFQNLQIRLSPDNPDGELWLIRTDRL